MIKIVNPDYKNSSTADQDALKAFLDGKSGVSFDDLRAGVPAFKNKKDGELHQIAMDAGLQVEI